MNPLKTAALAVAAALALVASSPAPAQAQTWRGTVVSRTPVFTMDPGQVKDFLTPIGVWVPEARHGVDAYRVVYRTVDVRGRSTTASTLVVLPRDGARRLKPAVWLHGTQSDRHDAPSVSPCCDRAAGVLFASLGYAATAPDYLGLGEGPGTHPYFHAPTMVSASIDALRATRAVAARSGRLVAGATSVAGFSQGANAAFLLAQALQDGADRRFSLGALAPISGAYRLFDVEWPAALGGDVDPAAAAYYLAYLTVAWDRVYNLYDDESEVFQAPYGGHVAELFDGRHTLDETLDALPAMPGDLLQKAYADRLIRPTGVLAKAAEVNDVACRDFTPTAPVRMYAAHGDPEAVFANSLACQESLRGADVSLTDVGDVNHITSLVLSVPQVARWFATLV
ncbi:lipase [Hamadaea sp. NPDC050747]|uniref:lipase n=1 Tax=Hamadaea sp. NPDC050747 TaxID=3155789 RepID=UPI0033CB7321